MTRATATVIGFTAVVLRALALIVAGMAQPRGELLLAP